MVVGGRELIDTLWNVNCIPLLCILKALLELIDTLWNVNIIFPLHIAILLGELIDTLWNVNTISNALFTTSGI